MTTAAALEQRTPRAERASRRLREFVALTKPRVLSLIIFTAVIGMFLASPGIELLPQAVSGAIGIALVAGAAAATNCLLERNLDAAMVRTRARPLPRGRLKTTEAAAFAVALGAAGLVMLHALVNPLTMWLTLATFAGYAIVYTLLLKPHTRHNIVLGGAAGAMPPLLGAIFVAYAIALYRSYSDKLAHATFRYSITYLALLFAALLADHYL